MTYDMRNQDPPSEDEEPMRKHEPEKKEKEGRSPFIRERLPGLIQHVLAVLAFWSWVLLLPRLPPSSRSLRLFPGLSRGHATTRFLEGFLEGSLPVGAS